jgi:peptidoglycan/xylan/chitin deacetylase (PgdA/CDA1 family)
MIAANAVFVKGGPRFRLVALTFDDGPSIYTPRLVHELLQLKAPATFFEVGSQIHRYTTLVANMSKLGFPIEDHTWNHPVLTGLSSTQVQGQLLWTKNAIFKATHVYPQFFRPPYGAQNARVRRTAGGLGMVTTVWSIDTRDWSRPGTSAIIAAAEKVRPGGIILMHDGGGNRSETLAAVPVIVRYLRAHGYTLVTIPQLLTKAPPRPSTAWLSAKGGGG